MAKITLAPITSGYVSVSKLNNNFAAITAAFENTLSRDGTSPNYMDSALDMNGNMILNQANPVTVSGLNWEGDWQTATAYTVGDAVYYNQSSYICVVDHTSGTFATDLAAIKWQLLATGGVVPSQIGNAGKYLTTDGGTLSWDHVHYLEATSQSTITTAVDVGEKALEITTTGSGYRFYCDNSGLSNPYPTVIDSAGGVILGYDGGHPNSVAPFNTGYGTSGGKFSIWGKLGEPNINIVSYSNQVANTAGTLNFHRYKTETVGDTNPPVANDPLGGITWNAGLYTNAAAIVSYSESDPTITGYAKGSMVFLAGDGAGTLKSLLSVGYNSGVFVTSDSANNALAISQSGSGNCLYIEDQSGDTSPTVVTGGGQFVSGHTTALTGIPDYGGTNATYGVQTIGAGTAKANYLGVCFANNNQGGGIIGCKSRNTTYGSHTVVNNNDRLCTMVGESSDGNQFRRSGSIGILSDGGSSAGSTPGKIIFNTTSVGTSTPVERLSINAKGLSNFSYSFGRSAPVTKTADFTVADTDNWLINNKAGATCTVILPTASDWTGRELMIKTIQAQTVVSASSNVVPLAGGAAGTAILAATAGKWATLVSNGTNWEIMQAN